VEIIEEKESTIRKTCNKMYEEGRLKRAAAQSDGRGSSGYRYRLPTGDNDDNGGGLPVL
jgi:hypothetical protein